MLSCGYRDLCRHASAGVTLIEAMVVIAILAVVTALAAPSFSTMIMNNRVRTAADGIMAGLQLARAEAIRRNSNVSFTLTPGAGWTVASVLPAATIQTRSANEGGTGLQVASLNNQNSVAFTSTGTVASYDPANTLTRVTIQPAAGVSGDSLRITIFAGGQIRLCNMAITTENDPRRC